MAEQKIVFLVEVKNVRALSDLAQQINALYSKYNRVYNSLKGSTMDWLMDRDRGKSSRSVDELVRRINFLIAAKEELGKQDEREARAAVRATSALQMQARAYRDAENAIANLSKLSAQYARLVEAREGIYSKEGIKQKETVAAIAAHAQKVIELANRYGVAQAAVERFGITVARAIKGLQTGLVGPDDFVRTLERGSRLLKDQVTRAVSRYSAEFDTAADKQRRAGEIMTGVYRKINTEVVSMANSYYLAARAVQSLERTSSKVISNAPVLSGIINYNRELIRSAQAHNIGEQAIAKYAIRIQRLNALYREGAIDAQRYVAGIRAASQQLQKSLIPELQRKDITQPGFFGNFAKGFGNFLVKLGVGVFVFNRLQAGIRYITDGLKSIADAYADLIEAQNFFNVAFGENAADMKRWVEDVSNTLFMNQGRLMQTVAQWKLILEDLGLGAENAIWLSKVFQKLAIDVASLRNADITKVTEAMISGLQGNIRPLRALGIDVSKATIEFYALASGIKTASGELSTLERVYGVAMAVIASTAADRGDFVATMGSIANQMRILNEQWILFKQRLGESTDKSASMSRVINNLSIAVRGLHGYVKLVISVLALLAKVIGTVVEAVKDIMVYLVGAASIAVKFRIALGQIQQILMTKGAFGISEIKSVWQDFNNEVTKTREAMKELLKMPVSEMFSLGGTFIDELLKGEDWDSAIQKTMKEKEELERLRETLERTGLSYDRVKAILEQYGQELSKSAESGTAIEQAFFRALRAADEYLQRTRGFRVLSPQMTSITDVPQPNLKRAMSALQEMMQVWSKYKDNIRIIQEEITSTDEKELSKRIELYRKWQAESERMAGLVGGVLRDAALRDAKRAASEITALQRRAAEEALQFAKNQVDAIIKLIEHGFAPEDAEKKLRKFLSDIERLYKQTGRSDLELKADMADWQDKINKAIASLHDYSKAWDSLGKDVDFVIKMFKDGQITQQDAIALLQSYLEQLEKLKSRIGDSEAAANIRARISEFFGDVFDTQAMKEAEATLEAMDSLTKNTKMTEEERKQIMRELYSELGRIIERLEQQTQNEEAILKLKKLQQDAAEKIASINNDFTTLSGSMTWVDTLKDIGANMGRTFSQQLSSSLVEAFGSGNVYRALMRSFRSLGVALGKSMAGGLMKYVFGWKDAESKTQQAGLIPGVFGFEDFWKKLSEVQKGSAALGMSGAAIQALMMLGTTLQAFGSYKSNRGMSALGGAMTGFSAYLGYAAVANSFNPIMAIVASILMAIVGWFAGNGKEQIKYAIGIRSGRAVVDEIYRMTKEEERAVQEQLQGRFDDIRNAFEGILIKLKQKITGLLFSDISFGTMENKRETINFQNALQAILQSELPRAMVAQVWPTLASALQQFGVQSPALLAWREKFDTGPFDKVIQQFIRFVDLLISATEASKKFSRSLDEVIAELEQGSFAAWSGDFSKGISEIQNAVDSIAGASIDTQLDVLGKALDDLSKLYDDAVNFLKQLVQLRKQIQETISGFIKDFDAGLLKKTNWSAWKDQVISNFNDILNWLANPPENVQPEDVQSKVNDLMNSAKQIEEIINYISSAIDRLNSVLNDINNIISELSITFSDFASFEGASDASNFRRTFSEAFGNIQRLGQELQTITDPAEYAAKVEEIRDNARQAADALKEFGRAIISAEKSIRESINSMLEDIKLEEFDKAGDVVGKGTYLIEQIKKYREMIATASSPEEVQYLIEQILKYAGMLRGMGDQILLDYNGQQMSVNEWLQMLLPELQGEADAALQKFKEEWENARNMLKGQLEGLADDVAGTRDAWKAEMDGLINLIKTGLGGASDNAVAIINNFITAVGNAITQINNLTQGILTFLQTLGLAPADTTTPPPNEPPPPQEPPGPPERYRPIEDLATQATGAAGAMSDVALAAQDLARTLNAINGSVQITLVVDPAVLVDVEGRSDLVRVVRRS